MESVGSNSPPPRHRSRHRFEPTQRISDRIVRALRQPLLLLHRSESNFFVLGATGNVYTVTLSTTPSCNCPDRIVPCKHILFIYLRVLETSKDDTCLRRRTLTPSQLTRLLSMSMSPRTFAGSRARERFHHLLSRSTTTMVPLKIELSDGATCPICLDDMDKEENVVECGTCRTALHKECMLRWKRSRGRSANCVICRRRWRERAEQDRYLNLAAYVTEDDRVDGGGLCGD